MPDPPLDDEAAESVRRLMEKGALSAAGLEVDDCHRTYHELVVKGVTFLQEPSEQPYGVEAVMRDTSGNWLVLVEKRPYSAAELATDAPQTSDERAR